MSDDPTSEEHEHATAAVFWSCVIVGLVVGASVVVLIGSFWGCVVGPVIGFIVAFVNPFIAASAANAAERLMFWAFPNVAEPWSTPKKAYTGAGWPFTLPYYALVCSFYWSINKHFPRS